MTLIKISHVQIDSKDMTLRQARQIPVKGWSGWNDPMSRETMSLNNVTKPPMICRVLERTVLGKDAHSQTGELCLVDTPTGLIWQYPYYLKDRYLEEAIKRGHWFDQPSDAPFVILK